MATRDLVFTIKDMDEAVLLGTAKNLGFDENGKMTLDEWWLDYFHHTMLKRMVKPAIMQFLTATEQAALDTASEAAVQATEAVEVTIA